MISINSTAIWTARFARVCRNDQYYARLTHKRERVMFQFGSSFSATTKEIAMARVKKRELGGARTGVCAKKVLTIGDLQKLARTPALQKPTRPKTTWPSNDVKGDGFMIIPFWD